MELTAKRSGHEAVGGGLDRVLRLFADVRPGEGAQAGLMLVSLFLLLVAYYVLKTVREPLILATGGAEMKAYASAVQALVLVLFIPLYGRLASRVGHMKLITFVTLFFLADIELFYVGALAGIPYLGPVFYVWVGIFSLASIAQFWSYANDIYRREDGERLFALVAIGATAGSWVGSAVAAALFRNGVGPYAMLHVTAGIVAVHLGLYWVVERRRDAGSERGEPRREEALSGSGGFRLVFASPYLRLVGVLLVLLNVVNTTGEYIISRSVLRAASAAAASTPGLDPGAFIGSFYGTYFFQVNLIAVLLQAFVVSRLVRRAGMGGVLFALPVVALGAYGLIGVGAGFALTRFAKTAENSTDYSVMNTARQMLWLPTSRAEKYKAKQALDTFFVRAGDVLSAVLVYAGTAWLGLDVEGFARFNVVLVGAWLLVALLVLRHYRALCKECP